MSLPPCAACVLGAFADTLYPPPLGLPHSPTTLLSCLPKYLETVIAAIESLSPQEVTELGLLLRALNTGVGTALIFTTLTLTPFADQDLETRTKMLNVLKLSGLPDRRKIFNGLKRILLGTAGGYSLLTEEEVRAAFLFE